MISDYSAKKKMLLEIDSDPLFVLAELLIKKDKREKVIDLVQSEKEVDEDKRNSDNTNQAE